MLDVKTNSLPAKRFGTIFPKRCPFLLAAHDALEIIEEAGGEAWCVGGFVRDALLGAAYPRCGYRDEPALARGARGLS